MNFPDLDVWELEDTCALDVADRGGITLEEVGEILNLTRERIRQVEVRGRSEKLKESAEDLGLKDFLSSSRSNLGAIETSTPSSHVFDTVKSLPENT